MTSPARLPDPRPASGAHAVLRVGDTVTLEAAITTPGLFAVAAIVGGALLGSAAIMLAAGRNRDAVPRLPHRRQG